MAGLTREEVLKIAELARLSLSETEVEVFARQLADILAYAQQVREVDTTGVMPTTQVLAQAIERHDETRESLARADALENAPDADRNAGLFRVPRVIGG